MSAADIGYCLLFMALPHPQEQYTLHTVGTQQIFREEEKGKRMDLGPMDYLRDSHVSVAGSWRPSCPPIVPRELRAGKPLG